MKDILIECVNRMQEAGAEFCDARHQVFDSETIKVVDGTVRGLKSEKMSGVCFRSRIGGRWGYSTSVSLDKESLMETCLRAPRLAAVAELQGPVIPERPAFEKKEKSGVKVSPREVSTEEKVEMVKNLDGAQQVEDRISNRNSTYRDQISRTTLVNSMSSEVEWEEVRTFLYAMAVASESGRNEFYYDIVSGTKGYELVENTDIEGMGRHCGEEAVKMLSAVKPPSGLMTCISDPANTGTLAHEVMGHASEADEITKKRSFLTGKVDEKVASDHITMVDDATLDGLFGSIPFDDEGTPASRTVIISDGVYRGYLHSLETAAQMGTEPTGNGRAQDFSRRIWARMTNTFFEPGDWTLEEMIEDIDYGLLTDKSISGMEDPVGGGFQAQAPRGYLIEEGEITDLVRSFGLTGDALTILQKVDAVGDVLEFEGAMCGKGIEDFVPVSIGGPYCRAEIMVGGD